MIVKQFRLKARKEASTKFYPGSVMIAKTVYTLVEKNKGQSQSFGPFISW